MTKEKILETMKRKANALIKNYTKDGENEIWNMASDWNRDHDGIEEIFMCEKHGDETDDLIGFYIEDDYWLYED